MEVSNQPRQQERGVIAIESEMRRKESENEGHIIQVYDWTDSP